jgi:hypothetical protein
MRMSITALAALAALGAPIAAHAAPSFSSMLGAICPPLFHQHAVPPAIDAATAKGYSVVRIDSPGQPLETALMKGPTGMLVISGLAGGSCSFQAPADALAALTTEFNAWTKRAPDGPYRFGFTSDILTGAQISNWVGPLYRVTIRKSSGPDGKPYLLVTAGPA